MELWRLVLQFVSPIDKCRAVSRVSRLWFYALFCSPQSWATRFIIEDSFYSVDIPASLIPLIKQATEIVTYLPVRYPPECFSSVFPHLTRFEPYNSPITEQQLHQFLQLNGSHLDQLIIKPELFNHSTLDFPALCPHLKCFPDGSSLVSSSSNPLRHWIALPRYSCFQTLIVQFNSDPSPLLIRVLDAWKQPAALPRPGILSLDSLSVQFHLNVAAALPLFESFYAGLNAASLRTFSFSCLGNPGPVILPASFLRTVFRCFPRLRTLTVVDLPCIVDSTVTAAFPASLSYLNVILSAPSCVRHFMAASFPSLRTLIIAIPSPFTISNFSFRMRCQYASARVTLDWLPRAQRIVSL